MSTVSTLQSIQTRIIQSSAASHAPNTRRCATPRKRMASLVRRVAPANQHPPMLNADDIQRLCQRKYPAFLKSVITGERFFPLDIRFGRPSTTDEWEKLRREITALAKGKVGYRIDWAETNTRRWGRQKFPERVWFENEAEFLGAVRKREEVEMFRTNLALTREQCP